MRQIKRYPNRKLYDAAEKRYVTLNDIALLIRDGFELQVTDHSTGEDLTAITLTQIIFEQEKRNSGFLPRSVLTGLIQAGGERLSTLRRALLSPLGMRHYVNDEIERRLSTLVEKGEMQEDEAAQLRDKLLFVNDAHSTGSIWDGLDTKLPQLLKGDDIPSRTDIELLDAQLELLEQKIDALLEGQE